MRLSATVSRAGGALTERARPTRATGYGRLFPSLLPWVPRGGTREEKLEYLYALSEELYRPRPAGNDGRVGVPAGYTYLAQFLNHDLSFDARNLPLTPTEPAQRIRTPALDLDSVYGLGPVLQPYLYQLADSRMLLLGATDAGEPDLPRTQDRSVPLRPESSLYRRRRAIIPDPRNDENLVVSQIHLAVMKFHNRRVRLGNSFAEARRQTRWHYQWLVVHDLLEKLCGKPLVDELLGRNGMPDLSIFPVTVPPFVPLEFAIGAFRAGHAMIRSGYVLNDTFERTFGPGGYPIFDTLSPHRSLVGGRELPKDWTIQWNRFFAPAGQSANPATCQLAAGVAPHIDKALRVLPLEENDRRYLSLSFRTLVRAWRLGLPSGQAVAEAITGSRPAGNDPLWLFVLREASDGASGTQLGPVGGRLVAEVIIGLLAADPQSYYRVQPDWEPDADERAGGRYTMLDFLRAAGVPVDEGSWRARRL
jgi:hypothetical protein